MVGDQELPKKCGVLIDVSCVREAPTFEQLKKIGTLVELVRLRFGDRVALVNSQVGKVLLPTLPLR